jgi:hypothetical protein
MSDVIDSSTGQPRPLSSAGTRATKPAALLEMVRMSDVHIECHAAYLLGQRRQESRPAEGLGGYQRVARGALYFPNAIRCEGRLGWKLGCMQMPRGGAECLSPLGPWLELHIADAR